MRPIRLPMPRALARADRDRAVARAVALILAAFPGTTVVAADDDDREVTR